MTAVVLSCSICVPCVVEVHVHMVVKGLVQGVGFRWFVAVLAKSLGLRGYVRNLPDGTVEIVAEGEKGILHDFIKHVRMGPSAARVEDVRIEWENSSNRQDSKPLTGFEIR